MCGKLDAFTITSRREARTQIQSDPYFDATTPAGTIAVIDSGVHETHVLFNNPRHLGVLRDCVNGGPQCDNTDNQDFNPLDECNHGTSVIGIIAGNSQLGEEFRGVTAHTVDSFKVTNSACVPDLNAILRGFQAALARGDAIISTSLGGDPQDSPQLEEAADSAYDMGAIVTAAVGNLPPGAQDNQPGTAESPAIAHKAIGVGAYDVGTQQTICEQATGPTPDSRVKPDIQAPTDTETASNASDTALQVFGGTSGSTPYAAGAAALVRDFLNGFGPIDNGQVYAYLIASGQSFSPDDIKGAGPLKLLLGGVVYFGMVEISPLQDIAIPFSVNSGDQRIDAAIWWPESATQAHNVITVQLSDPSNNEVASRGCIECVWQRLRFDGSPLAVGDWMFHIHGGVEVPVAPQTVYFVIHSTPFIPVTPESNECVVTRAPS